MEKRYSFPFISIFIGIIIFCFTCAKSPKADYPAKPVPFTSVHFSDGFWAPRIETNRTVTIPFAFKQCEDTGRIKNFDLASAALRGAKGGQFSTRYPFDDSDVYKLIEAAAYTLAAKPDLGLEAYVNGLIAKIAAAQEPDGYLYTVRTIGGPPPVDWLGKERWSNLSMSHELYNLGHLYEAAVAYDQATGKRALLKVALKSADLIAAEFGPGKRTNPPGHQEVEIGLVKLYRLTGKKKYLDLAKFFLDMRGREQGRKLYGEYSQDHKPVIEQEEAVGHAVRAGYMYTGMADVAALTGDRAYIAALDKIWDDVVSKKIYLTGGIGATGAWEGYGPAYRLPNASAYAETCAAIATFLWNSRMFLLKEDAKYIDVMERILYNGILSGISLSGNRFFYPNPLASFGQHERVPWFSCACCPPNVARVLASVPGYVYAVSGDRVYVNLYVQGVGKLRAGRTDVELIQSSEYPWDGDIRIEVKPEKPAAFALCVRIPGWAVGKPVPSDLYRYLDKPAGTLSLKVNGEDVPLNIEKGYAAVFRTWQPGDTIELSLPMSIHRVVAHEAIEDDLGRVAVERGPLVYCAEGVDNNGHASNLVLEDNVALIAESRLDLLNGLTAITGEAASLRSEAGKVISEQQKLTLIPYYAWAHRGKGEMEVWLAREADRARPVPEPTIASISKASASGGTGVEALNDQFEPENSNDHSTRYFHWWPKKGTLEWVQYDFKEKVRVSEVSVYWFDDTGEGDCRVPKSWRVLYKEGDKWVPVKNLSPYGVEKDKYNVSRFTPIRTGALRLEIQLPENFSSGIQEWKVK
jgi:hypothetical protein